MESEYDTMEEAPTLSEDALPTKRSHLKGKTNRNRMGKLSEDLTFVNWVDSDLDLMATHIQAGFRGAKIREEFKELEEKQEAAVQEEGKEIEARLGIDLGNPEVVKATTMLQAGFRGAITRRSLREKREGAGEVTESGSEYSTFTWVEESEGDEDEESLSEKPWTPVTAVGAAVGVLV